MIELFSENSQQLFAPSQIKKTKVGFVCEFFFTKLNKLTL